MTWDSNNAIDPRLVLGGDEPVPVRVQVTRSFQNLQQRAEHFRHAREHVIVGECVPPQEDGMFTLLCFSLVFRLTPASVNQLPTAPSPREVPFYYYPTKVGVKWIYQEGDIESTHVITGVVKQKNGFQVSIGKVTGAGKITPLEKYLVSENGLVQLPLQDAAVDKSFMVLQLPLKVEEKWEYTNRGDGAALKEAGTMKAFKPEEITVPAGTFTAVRVEAMASVYSGTILMKPIRTTYWYSPGVGLVKKIDYQNKTLLLKLFTIEEGR